MSFTGWRRPITPVVNRKPGRPAQDGATDLVSVQVTLTRAMVRRARLRGHGNLSLGLRKLLASDEADLRQRGDDDDD